MAKQITVKIKLAGVEREVIFTDSRHETSTWSHFSSGEIFAAKIGRGAKFHCVELRLVGFKTIEELRRAGYRENEIVGEDDFGQFMVVSWNASSRNRNAYVVDWADRVADTEAATKQKYYGSFKVGA